jgi:nitroimidazol reductase NimA-like FMN-containing flavoprotein (pyridoxamine 5'-phosphate oxidase superfamily)
VNPRRAFNLPLMAGDGKQERDLTRMFRERDKGVYDEARIREILHDGFICHLGIEVDGQPFVVPTTYAVVGDDLLIHGSAASRTLRRGGEAGVPVCVTVTHVDAFKLARSVFNHSYNYRSVMIFGDAEWITDEAAKREALRAFFESVFPGRWDEARPPNEKEWKATAIMRLPLATASAKVSEGPPEDEDEDYALDVWAGVVPIERVIGEPVADPALREGIAESRAARNLHKRY